MRRIVDGSAYYWPHVRYGPAVTADRRLAPADSSVWRDDADQVAIAHSPWQQAGRAANPAALGERRCDEDVLFVQVWAPRRQSREPDGRPVVVWLHGGGLMRGSATWPIYRGAELAEQLGAVVVGVGYRLGLWGWAGSLPSLSDQLASQPLIGLGDQREALNWVHRQIAAYGGDASRVTVMGHSAGALCALALAQDSSPGLFSRMVLLSVPLLPDRPELFERLDDLIAAGTVPTPDLRRDSPESLVSAGACIERAWAELTAGPEPVTVLRPHVDDTSASRQLPVLATWVDGELGESMGGQLRSRLDGYLRRTACAQDQFIEISWPKELDVPPNELHLSSIPLVFGQREQWRASALHPALAESVFVPRQRELHERLKAFING